MINRLRKILNIGKNTWHDEMIANVAKHLKSDSMTNRRNTSHIKNIVSGMEKQCSDNLKSSEYLYRQCEQNMLYCKKSAYDTELRIQEIQQTMKKWDKVITLIGENQGNES